MKKQRLTTKKDSKLFNNGPSLQTCIPRGTKRQAKLKAGLKLDWDVLKPGMVVRIKHLSLLATVKEEQQQYELVTLDQ